jgi:hypothetical protein
MLSAYESGNAAVVLHNAEAMMNLLVGNQNPDYRDWNRNGQIADAGDGFGLLLNGNNLGYIQAVYSQADYAANTPGATQKMITHGGDVKTCVQNLASWAPELRDHLSTIITASSNVNLEAPIRDTAALTDRMLNGVDANNNGRIEAIPGECGVLSTYEFAYYMADMPLLPVSTFLTYLTGTPPTPTPMGTFINITGTPSLGAGNGSGGGSGGSGNLTNTPGHTPPGQVNTPPGQVDKTQPVPPTQKPKNNNNNKP